MRGVKTDCAVSALPTNAAEAPPLHPRERIVERHRGLGFGCDIDYNAGRLTPSDG